MNKVRTYELHACEKPECGYWRQEKSMGVHQTSNPRDYRGALVTHDLEPVTAIDARDVEGLVGSVESFRAWWRDLEESGLPLPARLPGDPLDTLFAALAPFDSKGEEP